MEQRGFVASWDTMSALNPGILALHLVLPQFLQAQPKHCHAHVQSTEDSHNVVHNGKLAGVKIPESDPTGQALLSLLHHRQDGAQQVPFSEVK